MKNVMTGAYVHNGETYEFNFGTNLSTVEKLIFVNSVVDILVEDKNYNSIIRDLIFDFFVVDIFSDVDTSELMKSPTFVDDVEQFLEESNIIDIIMANVDYGVIDELNKAINLNIEYRTGIHTNHLNESLARLINSIENKINEFDLGSIMDMAQKFVGMTGEFTPDSIVNAYLNSDVHKKNVLEIEETNGRSAEIAEGVE